MSDPRTDALTRFHALVAVGLLAIPAIVATLLLVAACLFVVGDVQSFATADECQVSHYAEVVGPSDESPIDVRFVRRDWLPPAIVCEATWRAGVTSKDEFDHDFGSGMLSFALVLWGLCGLLARWAWRRRMRMAGG